VVCVIHIVKCEVDIMGGFRFPIWSEMDLTLSLAGMVGVKWVIFDVSCGGKLAHGRWGGSPG
jgi:hypothetical protein